ncbi:hypothetical protein PHLCEN_2v6101 [Hermanssonia centrifuga]|uniref:Uncharacterized protein n=1 Tax=Hermanssonia centrifuga TaxID=98765 RepID=A0A2R6P0D5_9APHY|nr:hypothetical protein PHLCEN_2v6101 [Hermanssonia centrifuga]
MKACTKSLPGWASRSYINAYAFQAALRLWLKPSVIFSLSSMCVIGSVTLH